MSAIHDGQTILFIGDSITDCGRRGPEAPLGNGYVAFFRELMAARFPERNVTVINKGIGGNRVSDLAGRWEDDVARHRPDWLSIKIGINDLHSALRKSDDAITPEKFETLYDSILSRTAAVWKPELVLVSPFYISTDRDNGSPRSLVLDMLPDYIDVTRRMAKAYGARFFDLQAIFVNHLKYREADFFCPEPVHPFRAGHLVIAEAIMQAIAD